MTNHRQFALPLVSVLLALLIPLRGDAGSGLQGTWHLDTSRSVLTSGLLQYRATLEQVLRIDVTDDHVTVVTTTFGITRFAKDHPATTSAHYELDGQSHLFPWSDTIPRDTVARTARWLPDMSGFDLIEAHDHGARIVQRWRMSRNDDILTIDYGTPERNHRVLVFARQP